MKIIYKYPLCTEIHHNLIAEIYMPKGAKILTIKFQENTPVIWAVVNPKNPVRKRLFHVFGTGFQMIDYEKKHYEYIETIQQLNTIELSRVWHIFEIHE